MEYVLQENIYLSIYLSIWILIYFNSASLH